MRYGEPYPFVNRPYIWIIIGIMGHTNVRSVLKCSYLSIATFALSWGRWVGFTHRDSFANSREICLACNGSELDYQFCIEP
ncbi:hypothetical protein V1508DRAFT_37930 [Lipomyces doorenjongii]|uniref:uncharacterized protein n=1 Tax=Lipomyces doorenjongii TaxID=383834 RepID=UPI0034CE7432